MIILINCIVYNILLVVSLLLLLKKNPRYMMQNYPKDLQQKVQGKTKKEKKESILFGLPFLSIIILYPLFFGMYGKLILENNFVQNSLSIFVIIFSFNLIDLLFIDWLIFCNITPNFIVLPGTEKEPGYKNYYFHFKAFLKGSILSVLAATIVALLIEGVNLLIL